MGTVIILGNGPAGISAALYAARAGMETKIIAKDTGSLAKAEQIENYYGFETPISGEDLAQAGIAQAKRLGVQFVQEEVIGISFGQSLVVKTNERDYAADSVVIATGSARTTPKIPGLHKLEGKGVSYCAVCDAFFYRGKAVAVLGCGKYARSEVEELLPVVHSVTVLTNGAIPEEEFPESVAVVETEIAQLQGEDRLERVLFADGTALELAGIFVAYGIAGSADLAKKIGAITNGTKIVVDENMATNIPGLYAAGDCTGGMLQIAKAVHEGATAGTQAVKYIREQERNHTNP